MCNIVCEKCDFYCTADYEIVHQYIIENGTLVQRTVFEGEVEEYGYVNGTEIEELRHPITMHKLSEGFTW